MLGIFGVVLDPDFEQKLWLFALIDLLAMNKESMMILLEPSPAFSTSDSEVLLGCLWSPVRVNEVALE